jgi:hypothetical protein
MFTFYGIAYAMYFFVVVKFVNSVFSRPPTTCTECKLRITDEKNSDAWSQTVDRKRKRVSEIDTDTDTDDTDTDTDDTDTDDTDTDGTVTDDTGNSSWNAFFRTLYS